MDEDDRSGDEYSVVDMEDGSCALNASESVVDMDALTPAPSISAFFEDPERYAPRVEFLSEYIEDETMLTRAIKLQKEAAVRSLIKLGADVNELDKRGVAPLSAAAYKGSLQILNMIISAGANINAQNHSGSTALIQASHFGNVGAVKILLENHAYSDIANAKGTTALMRASQEGHEQVCALLISHGADVNRKNLEGMSSLMLASQRGLANMATYLINSNAYIDEQTSQGSTALMLACKRGHQACVEVLIFRGAEIYMKDLRGRTARDTATKKNFPNLLNILDTQYQIRRIQQDVLENRNSLLFELKQAHENHSLVVDSEEVRAIRYLRTLHQHNFILGSSSSWMKGSSSPHANSRLGGCDKRDGSRAEVHYCNGLRPVGAGGATSARMQSMLLRRQALSTSPATSMCSTPPVESEEVGSVTNSPLPLHVDPTGTTQPPPITDRCCMLPANARITISAELGDRSSKNATMPSILKRRENKSAEWEWSIILHRVFAMPKEIFDLVIQYLPFPRIWQWSLSKLRNRSKLAAHAALDDILIIIDEILCDANIFWGPQKHLLSHLNTHPEIPNLLESVWGMPSTLVKTLQSLADIQSLRARTSEMEVTFRAPIVKKVLAAAIDLFKWYRYRSCSQRIAFHAMSSTTRSRADLTDAHFGGLGGYGMLDSMDGADVTGTDVAGSDELEILDQDTENEVANGFDDNQQDYDSDSNGNGGGARSAAAPLHRPLQHQSLHHAGGGSSQQGQGQRLPHASSHRSSRSHSHSNNGNGGGNGNGGRGNRMT